MTEIEAEAKGKGIGALSVSSNPTGSAMCFYMKHGFEIISMVDKSIIKAISGDVVLAKSIRNEH